MLADNARAFVGGTTESIRGLLVSKRNKHKVVKHLVENRWRLFGAMASERPQGGGSIKLWYREKGDREESGAGRMSGGRGGTTSRNRTRV